MKFKMLIVVLILIINCGYVAPDGKIYKNGCAYVEAEFLRMIHPIKVVSTVQDSSKGDFFSISEGDLILMDAAGKKLSMFPRCQLTKALTSSYKTGDTLIIGVTIE